MTWVHNELSNAFILDKTKDPINNEKLRQLVPEYNIVFI